MLWLEWNRASDLGAWSGSNSENGCETKLSNETRKESFFFFEARSRNCSFVGYIHPSIHLHATTRSAKPKLRPKREKICVKLPHSKNVAQIHRNATLCSNLPLLIPARLVREPHIDLKV